MISPQDILKKAIDVDYGILNLSLEGDEGMQEVTKVQFGRKKFRNPSVKEPADFQNNPKSNSVRSYVTACRAVPFPSSKSNNTRTCVFGSKKCPFGAQFFQSFPIER